MSWSVTVNQEKIKEAEEKTTDFKPLEKGWYECFITGVDADIVSSQKGTPGLEIVLTVRDDVEQPGKRKKVWETLWVSPKAMIRIQKLLTAVGRMSGEATKEEMPKILKGKPILVEIDQDEYTKNDGSKGVKNLVTFLGFKQSEVGGSAPVDPFENSGETPIDISDDDLPF